MKSKIILFIALILMMLSGQGQVRESITNSKGKLSLHVRDGITGYGIKSKIIFYSFKDTMMLSTDDGGILEFIAIQGRYDLVINAPGYKQMQTFFYITPGDKLKVDISMDRVIKKVVPEINELSKAIIEGYVVDGDNGKPIEGADVFFSIINQKIKTNEQGYFKIESQLFSRLKGYKNDNLIRVTIEFVKKSFGTHEIKNLLLINGIFTLKITLNKGNDNSIENYYQGILDKQNENIEKDRNESQRNNTEERFNLKEKTEPFNPQSCPTLPSTIRVGTGCPVPVSCTALCTGAVQVMSLESYVQSGLDNEWFSSWDSESLKAGAVAYRTYGAYYVAHPSATNYDIRSDICNQAWSSGTATSCINAANATVGEVIVNSSNVIVKSEYAAENNDNNNPNSTCGNCFSGGNGWPCISDNVCCGETFNGHGRGMCQWGSQRWAANQNQTYTWILDHYYNPGGFFRCSGTVTTPPNDDCSGAILLASSTTCNYLTNQTVNDATASGKPKGTCDAYTGTPALADVWYYFQAQSQSHTITVDPNGSALDAVIVVYNSCTNNAEVGCSDTPGGNGTLSTLSLTGLTCGNYYYIRVYDYGLQTTNGGFRICVTQSGGLSNPIASAATGITLTSFQANWGSVSAATSYRLDVSLNSSFSSYVPGYQDLNVGNATSFGVSGLTCNTQYYYRIRANNSCGTSSNSNIINTTTTACCTAPSNPTSNAASNINLTSFQANWGSISAATSYRLDVSLNSSFSSYVPGYQDLIVGNVTSFAVSGLTCNTQYYYRIRANNSCGTSGNSNIINTTTTACCTAPSNPTANVASNINATSFQANWGNVGAATSYRLDVSLDPAFSSYVLGYQDLNVGNVASFAVSGLTCNTQYYYRIRANNSCGTSGNSNIINTTTSACCTTPSNPTANVASNINATSFQTNWGSVGAATSYRLDVSLDPAFSSYVPGYQDLNVGNVASFAVNGLTCNTQYYYRIRANNSCGTSGNSNIINTTTSACCTTPSNPTANVASNINATSFQANWGSVGAATSYRLDVSLDPAFSSYIPGYQDLNVGNVTSFSVTGLTCNTTYYYRVRSNNSCGTSGNSNIVSVSMGTCCTAPSNPIANVASNINATSFQANWGSVSAASSYRLDVSFDVAFSSYVTGYQDLNVNNVTSYSVNGLTCNTIYYYRIRANNGCGTSGNSNVVSVSMGVCCTAPSNPTAYVASNINPTSFQANWGSVSAATSYRLDVSLNSAFSSYVPGYQDLNVGNVTSFGVSGLICNTIYYYRVRASNSCGASGNSNTINILTAGCCTAPSSPIVNIATNITSSTFTANWNPVSGATSYYLDVSTNSAFTTFISGYNNLQVTNQNSWNVNGLACRTPYYYRVRAFNNCGPSLNSGIANVLTADCCTPPISPTVKPTSNVISTAFTANWNPVSGATSYYLDVATDVTFTNFVNGYNNLNVGNTTLSTINGLACNTTYYYRISAFNNCGPSINPGIFSIQTSLCSVHDIPGLEEFSVLPNPNNGDFIIKMKLSTIKDVVFKVYNNLGQLVHTSENYKFSGSFVKNMSLSNLSHGVYSLQTNIDNEFFTVNIVIIN